MSGETVLVTGGSGYVAGFCIAALLAQGYKVKTTVRSLSREAEVRASLAKLAGGPVEVTFVAADLSADAGWDDAAKNCTYVLHVASPFPTAQPKDPDELIIPARDGALRVLKAAVAAGVKRVVLTSSVAAIAYGHGKKTDFDERDWTDVGGPEVTPYVMSKTIAEKAAWEWMGRNGGKTELAVINPAAIIGPAFSKDVSTSLAMVSRLMDGSTPGMPRIGFNIVDTRDLADLHLLAMTAPQAAGERFIASGAFLWMSEAADILRARMDPKDTARIPTRKLPDFVVRIVALFDPGIRSVLASLGKRRNIPSTKAHNVLGWKQRPVEDTIYDCGQSLVAEGLV